MLCTDPKDIDPAEPWCYVHALPMPCLRDGGAAVADPLHVFAEPDQIDAVHQARTRARGSRPIIVHEGPAKDGHITETGKDCWCETTTIPAGRAAALYGPTSD
jgi:hypothetical protein